jgi:lysophospholipase L1-like esterase
MERDNPFCALAEEVSRITGTGFIDLRNMIADQYTLLGPVRTAELFPGDHTHTGPDGALLNAATVVSGLKALQSPLTHWLSEEGQKITPYGPLTMMEQFRQWLTAAWMPEVQPEPDSALPTLYAIGNSTVRTGTRGDGASGQWGWGAPIADYFDRSRLNVENRALGGTSSRTFRTMGLWEAVLRDVKAGDFVIMQFGHNDSSPVNDNRRARGTLEGNGEDAVEIDNMLTGKHEIVHSYGWYIRHYIKETRAKGATPVVCSLIPRNRWTDGKINRSVNGYALWASEAAAEEGAVYIDLNTQISDFYDRMGQDWVTALCFDGEETTHTNAVGARVNAACLVEGIRSAEDLPLKDYLKKVP